MPYLVACEPAISASLEMPGPSARPRTRAWIARLLDTAIALYATSLVALALTGGFDLGWVHLSHAAKPVLILLLLIPTRVALREPSWLAAYAGRLRARARPGMTSVADRIPPAVRDVLLAFGATTPAVFAVAFLVNILFPSPQARPFAMPFAYAKFAETFAAWDSGWYFDIARRGYFFSPDGQSSVPFFPLYPIAMRALAWPFGASERALWVCGIAISCAASFAALVVLHRLTERICNDREVARRTVLYVTVFPFSFFLTRVYPSGLFFLLTVLAVYAASRSRWRAAGVWGALATLTRPHGVLIAVPLGLMAFRGGDARQIGRRLAPLVLIPAALAAYSGYIYRLTGDPLAWLHSEEAWGFSLWHAPWQQLLGLLTQIEEHGLYMYFFSSALAPYRLFHGMAAMFLLVMIPAIFRRLGVALGAYVLVNLLIPLSGNALEGIGRYAAAWFPVFIVMGMWQSTRLREAILITWSLLLALFVGLFVTWHPIY